VSKEENNIVREYDSPVKSLNSEDFKGKYNSKNQKIGFWIEEHNNTHDWKNETLGYELISNGHYEDGVKVGEWREQIGGPYFNNKTGKYIEYILRRRGEYLNGYKTGKWKYYFILGGCDYWCPWEHPEQYGFGYYDKGRKVNIWERKSFRKYSWISNLEPPHLGKTLEKIDYSTGKREFGLSLLVWDGIRLILPNESTSKNTFSDLKMY
tara:strand:- start:107 stop:733 length:627 start_codon:yes stop_codon:yes gene_type:complete